MNHTIEVRGMQPADAAAVAVLLAELGYPCDASSVPARLHALVSCGAAAFVATLGEVVVGLASLHLLPVIHEDAPRGLLTALVVSESVRGRGIGRTLVQHVEQAAANRGVQRLIVTTANHRRETHVFYERLGWEWTGRRYATQLRPRAAAGAGVSAGA